MLLTGTFVRSIDDKQRVALPKPFRDAMNLGPQPRVYIAPFANRSLAIYTEPDFTALAQRMSPLPGSVETRDFGLLFYGQAAMIDVDSQGRVRLPPDLLRLAGLDKEVALLGLRDHLELWDRARWEQFLAERAPKFDEITLRAFASSPGGSGAP